MSRDNLFALVFFIISLTAFFMWGYSYIPSNHLLLFILASIFGLFMAFNIGGNDVANSFGTSVGAKTLTLKQALVIAAVFELSGAVFAGAEVTNTIRSGIISLPKDSVNPMTFVIIMISALFSSGAWLFIATKKGLPVSTTHSIVGGIVGAGLMMGFIYYDGSRAFEMVRWSEIGSIALSWVVSPVMGGVVAYLIFGYIKSKIIIPSSRIQSELKALKRERKTYKEQYIKELSNKSETEQIKELRRIAITDEDECEGAECDFRDKIKVMKEREKSVDTTVFMRTHIPMVAGAAAMIIAGSMLFKGLKHTGLNLSSIQTLWIIFVIGIAAYLVSFAVVNLIKKDNASKSINRIFGWFQIFTASSFAFSHGANDIANAVGPFAAILDVLKHNAINEASPVPGVAMATFGIALVVGLWFLGKEVITTVGSKLAEILPTTGFSAELASSIVILIATQMGLPISSTHVLIGAVLGIGIYNRNANWGMLKPIGLAWIITLPVSMIGSAVGYLVIKNFMGL
ncbi:inorganic phosphate transporter, PitA family [Campylobacter iguaniorum]|uniref:inorganic phosphate transporter n=1 Tax=Campylobacter iguaniorum TaxID=1244531 RepID=UPI00073A20E5|nr:inorganic phosphate transporter [Campylobacter iguaniorum]ALV24530.1 inorganic phosphate transporter, PitA family [Campylobacter iguaniorum]